MEYVGGWGGFCMYPKSSYACVDGSKNLFEKYLVIVFENSKLTICSKNPPHLCTYNINQIYK